MMARFHQLVRGCRDKRYEIILLSLIMFFVIADLVGSATRVQLTVDGTTKSYATRARTVAAVLRENGIQVKARDDVTPELSARLTDGMVLKVQHAVPVTIRVNKQQFVAMSAAETVGGVLKDAGLTVSPMDKVTPGIDQKAAAGMTVNVALVTSQCEVTKAEMPYQTVTKPDPKLPYGARRVITKGKPGLLVKVSEIVYEGGQPVRKQDKAQSIITPPLNEVVAVGTKRKLASLYRTPIFVSRGDDRAQDGGTTITMHATAYAPNYGPGVGTRCANGMRAQKGVVAVDPRVIPLGTRLYIQGYGHAIAADTGGDIKGTRIDLCYNTPEECFQFGRRPVKVTILGR